MCTTFGHPSVNFMRANISIAEAAYIHPTPSIWREKFGCWAAATSGIIHPRTGWFPPHTEKKRVACFKRFRQIFGCWHFNFSRWIITRQEGCRVVLPQSWVNSELPELSCLSYGLTLNSGQQSCTWCNSVVTALVRSHTWPNNTAQQSDRAPSWTSLSNCNQTS